MNITSLSALLQQASLSDWVTPLQQRISSALDPERHGDLPRWRQALANMPDIQPGNMNFNSAAVSIGSAADCTTEQQQLLCEQLQRLHPWRKGPFDLFGVLIDTEWQSWMKWQRLQPTISPLHDRRVLDVGCGNGYYGWRMLGDGARQVIGIDPSPLFYMQHRAVQHYAGDPRNIVIPVAMEDLPAPATPFDTVFSMGVIYHRKEPLQHLLELKQQLRAGGELVLEGLVIEGKAGELLQPATRYAKMRNVWTVPTPDTMLQWLAQCGFHHARCVDVSITSIEEQRTTEWMQFESLADFLDPQDATKTIEGYPAPARGIFIANV
jgi:tRNA (mo5U34)-methyltransferase